MSINPKDMLSGPSKSGATLADTSGSLVDANGGVWKLVDSANSGRQITLNGNVLANTANVTLLLWYNNVIYQQNAAGNWWSYTPAAHHPWTQQSGDPRAGSGTGPAATGSLVTADFGSPTGNTLYPTVFGSSMASDVPPYGEGNWADPNAQAAARHEAGFGLPGMYVRINPAGGDWGSSPGAPNMSRIQALCNTLPKIIDVNTAMIAYNAGPDVGNRVVPDPTVFGQQCVQVAQQFAASGLPVKIWEIFNESNCSWDSSGNYTPYINDTDYCRVFNGAADALHAYNPNLIVAGRCYCAGIGVGDWTGFGNTCGSRIGQLNWHSYVGGQTDSDSGLFSKTIQAYQLVSGIRSAVAGTPAANVPACMGEWGIGPAPSNATIVGAINAILAIHTTFTADPLTKYGSIWDWLGDGYWGLIIDPNNNPGGYQAYQVRPTAYALKLCRAFMGGAQVSVSGASGNVRYMATKSGSRASVYVLNFDTSASFNGTVGFSHWPYNSTGNGQAQVWQLSPSPLQPTQASTPVTNGVTGTLAFPPYSLTIITTG